jgi:RNA methyltransferase, TrmH family
LRYPGENDMMERITSPANKKIKELSALLRKASLRREQGVFVVEGPKIFGEAPDERIVRVFAGETFFKDAADEVKDKIRAHEAFLVADDVLEKTGDTKTTQGILAVVRMREAWDDMSHGSCAQTLKGSTLSVPRAGAYVILERLQDPGNLGTIIRSAEAAGFSVIMDRETVDIYSPKVVRSTMGAIFRVNFAYTDDLEETITELKSHGVRIFAAHLKGERAYDLEDYGGASAFLIGNESAGLTDRIASMADTYVRIPMLGKVESLNASVAASVLMFEAARQRRNR